MSKTKDIIFKSNSHSNISKDLLPAFNSQQISNILRKIKEAGQIWTIMTVIEPFNEMFLSSPAAISGVNTPPACSIQINNDADRLGLMTYFKIENKDKTIVELREMANSIIIAYSDQDIELMEKMTKSQANSLLWFELRAGRITASNFKLVCATKINKPAISTIKKFVTLEILNRFKLSMALKMNRLPARRI